MSGLPLASSQRGIWFDQMLHHDQPIYNMSGCLRIKGALDSARFEAATHELIARNDILRIVLRQGAGADLPTQDILLEFAPALPFMDFSQAPGGEGEAREWMRAQVERTPRMFDRPLFDFALIKISDDEYWWFHTYHHIICDAYGHSLLVNQLAAIYSGAASDLPIHSYIEYIRADQELQASPKWQADLAYWGERFATLPAPMVESKNLGDAVAHERHVLTLPRAFYDRMAAFAAANGASTFHLILAALYVRFTRATGREDFVIGLPALNRGSAAFKVTAGLFTGVTPAWFALGLDFSTPDLLAAIAGELRRDYRHQRIPLHEINRRAGLYSTGRAQIYDIILSYQKHSYDVLFDGHSVEQISLRHGAEKTPLAFEVSEYNDMLDVHININYSTAIFTAQQIAHMGEQLHFILGSMMDDPTTKVRDVDVLPPAERRLVLGELAVPRVHFPANATLVDRFEHHARTTPEAIAVVADGNELTYAQLNRRADEFARLLRQGGVGPGVPVGISLDRSLDFAIGVLAILKAGGAYVPIDPADPPARRAHIVADAGLRLVVEAIAGGAPENETLAPARARPEDPACILYVADASGVSKGTVLTHHNFVRLFAGMDREHAFGPHDCWALTHSFALDLSAWELFGALVHGARATLVPYWVSRSPDALLEFLSEQKVNVLTLTPYAFEQMISMEPQTLADLAGVRCIIVTGAVLGVEGLRAWFELHQSPPPTLIAAYGMTETTMFAAVKRVSAGDLDRSRPTIGTPLCDTWIYVLDAALRPAPVGVAGEVYIGGAGVAAGYLDRAEMTTAHFRANPFVAQADARMYRTGARARYLPDGEIEYMGHCETEYSREGFRIEPREVALALQAHPDVARADVKFDAHAGQLHAAIEPAHERAPSSAALRAFLRESLPAYMVPAMFSGASDAPRDERAAPSVTLLPVNALATQLAMIWQEELEVEHVALNDNVFELGGHSLLLVRVQHRIASELGHEFSMTQMFAHPTVAALALAATGGQGS